MNKLIKQIIESKYNFNIDIESSSDLATLHKQKNITKSLERAYDESLFIDLDLPSRNLWAKYNFGVNQADLKTATKWFGNFYAWGELKPKENYEEFNYKFNAENISETLYTKYNRNPDDGLDGYVDNLTQLEPCDDVVNQKFGGNYCIPAKEDMEELIQYTTQEFTIHNDIKYENPMGIAGLDYLNGLTFTSSKDTNKSIFIPCAGLKTIKSNINKYGDQGANFEIYLWTSTLEDSENWINPYPYTLNFKYYWKEHQKTGRSMCEVQASEHRYEGCPVRGILKMN